MIQFDFRIFFKLGWFETTNNSSPTLKVVAVSDVFFSAGGFGRNFGCSFSTGLLWHLGRGPTRWGSQNTRETQRRGWFPCACFFFSRKTSLKTNSWNLKISPKSINQKESRIFRTWIFGFHVSFRDPLEVQSTKTKCLVFRMIHGARIPDPTKGQSLVKDFLNICLFGKMDWFDFDSGC